MFLKANNNFSAKNKKIKILVFLKEIQFFYTQKSIVKHKKVYHLTFFPPPILLPLPDHPLIALVIGLSVFSCYLGSCFRYL